MKKILIIYATAGAGHRKAAEAVYEGLRDRPGVEARLVDVLDYTTGIYRHSYSRSYTFLISRTPALWGFLFWLLDIPWLQPLIRLVRRVHYTVHAQPLVRLLRQEQYDAIISTHFMPHEVAGHLKRQGKIHSKIICVVTDFDVHKIWLAAGVDAYAVASGWTAQKITSLGVERAVVRDTGIPTAAKFSQAKDVEALKARLGLRSGVFTVLVATGSFGIGPIEEIIAALDGIQVVVVCGHNQDLYARLNAQARDLVKVCGLVNNMDELMAVADVMITKPGGLSISEALVSGLPLIFFNAIPGQETNNIMVLKEHGIGISDCPVRDMATILKRYQAQPQEFSAARAQTQKLARPRAVEDILRFLD